MLLHLPLWVQISKHTLLIWSHTESQHVFSINITFIWVRTQQNVFKMAHDARLCQLGATNAAVIYPTILNLFKLSVPMSQSTKDQALDLLQHLCANDLDVPVGHIVHTGMLNERGGYENDCSVVRLSKNRFVTRRK